jgi:ribonucleoside-diphosphate reductase beta chain
VSASDATAPRPLPLFGEAWAARWAAEVDGSDAYRRAAAGWEGALVLRLAAEAADPRASAPDGAGRETGAVPAVWADLFHGRCRGARAAMPADLATAPFVLEAPLAIWQRLLEARLDPLWAVISGKVKLARGSVAALVPWAGAARELVAAARRVPTAFPGAIDAAAPAPAVASPPAGAEPVRSAEPALASRVYQTTSPRGLDREAFPMRLWQKAKRRGVWNPSDLDLARDREQWLSLSEPQHDVLLRLASLFQAGEESVTVDLLPLIQVVAAEGRLEEELFLTSFLFEEAKHVEFFRRFFDEVAGCGPGGDARDLAAYHSPSYRAIVYDALPRAMARLAVDRSPVAQAEASVTYNLIVEGVLAETGYHAFFTILERRDLLPGVREGIALLRSDEARHLAYGVWLLSRLVAAHGEPVWQAIEGQMERLLPAALGIVDEAFDAYETMPFELDRAEFLRYATRQFEARLARIGRAREGIVVDAIDLVEA